MTFTIASLRAAFVEHKGIANRIAKALGVSIGRVLGAMRRIGLPVQHKSDHGRPPRCTDDEIRAAFAANRGRLVPTGIALGLSREAVRYHARKLGLRVEKARPAPGAPTPRQLEIWALFQELGSKQAVADRLRITRCAVRRRLAEYAKRTAAS